MLSRHFRLWALAGSCALALSAGGSAQQSQPKNSVQVKIEDGPADRKESLIDPAPFVHVNGPVHMNANLLGNDARPLHATSIRTTFNIDGKVIFSGLPIGRMVVQNQPLAMESDKRARTGFISVYELDKLTITLEVEVVPSKTGPGRQQRRDAAMFRYCVHNQDSQPHKVGVRVFLNPLIGDSADVLFVTPDQPNKALDGVELKGKDMPNYVRLSARPKTGHAAHLTYSFGPDFERPGRLVLTGRRDATDGWNLQPVPAMGTSGVGFYWDPKEIEPGAKRNLAYGFGGGIASRPEGEGVVQTVFGGSFEPGNLFTVTAYVKYPAHAQVLTLELPAGMELVEGKELRPVPQAHDEYSLVSWKARTLKTGRFVLRVHSSAGASHTKIITVSR